MFKSLLIFLMFVSFGCNAQTLEIFELQKRCSVEASNYLSINKGNILSPATDAINQFTTHYNKKNGWCLLRIDTTIPRLKDFKTIEIWNVLENKNLVSFVSGNHTETKKYFVIVCKLSNGKRCTSEFEAEQDAEKIMNE